MRTFKYLLAWKICALIYPEYLWAWYRGAYKVRINPKPTANNPQ